MNPLRSILSNTSQVAQDASCFIRESHPFLVPFALAAFGGITLAAFGTFVLTETGGAILSEIRRRRRLAAPHPASPSLRGTPAGAEIAADCAERPRTLHVRLRLGSRLADLEPTLDAAPRCTVSATGARRFVSRGPGLKGWLADHRIDVGYSTLVKYRTLALRLRQLLALDARIPLEWLLPGELPDRPLPAAIREAYAVARRRLSGLLRAHPNFSRLRRRVDAELGILRLPSVRRAGKTAGKREFVFDADRLETAKHEFIRLLGSSERSPKLDRLRGRAVEWLGAGVDGVGEGAS